MNRRDEPDIDANLEEEDILSSSLEETRGNKLI